jgi:hypothetical protein
MPGRRDCFVTGALPPATTAGEAAAVQRQRGDRV